MNVVVVHVVHGRAVRGIHATLQAQAVRSFWRRSYLVENLEERDRAASANGLLGQNGLRQRPPI